MSESKLSKSLFLVVDHLGARTAVSAERMWWDGPALIFSAAGKDVASFVNPISAVDVSVGSAPRDIELTPGAAVRTFRPRWSGLDWLMFGALVVNAALMFYDQFGVAG